MADLLALSARFIDEGIFEGPGSVNRVTTELSEISEDISVVEAFSHVVTFKTGDGLVLFDTSLEAFAGGIKNNLRAWSDEPINTIAFTHGHIDHISAPGLSSGRQKRTEIRGRGLSAMKMLRRGLSAIR